MSMMDQIVAAGNIATAFTFLIAALTLWWTWWQYHRDQLQQRTAQMREELQTIVGDCNRFLRPLGQEAPYPILHTATAITKEICTRLGTSPRERDVKALLNNENLLLSICVEGWIGSSQIRHLVDLAEEVEHKASSHSLQGKLLLICYASFLLAGLVTRVCSPEAFYKALCEVKPSGGQKDNVEDILNIITVDLQERICKRFDEKGKEGISDKEAIQRSLYFIQTLAGIFINLEDANLMRLAKDPWKFVPFYPGAAPIKAKIEQASSLSKRFDQVMCLLDDLEKYLNQCDHKDLRDLIEPVRAICIKCETSPTSIGYAGVQANRHTSIGNSSV